MSELTELTRRLVSIPSHEDESAAGDAIESWLREETDAEVTRDDHGNVFARRGASDAPALALVGHHDVVPPSDDQVASRDDDETPTRLAVEERDGRLYGRGTADMKGAVAAAMLAFKEANLGRGAQTAATRENPDGAQTAATRENPDGAQTAATRENVNPDSPVELVFASFVAEEQGGLGAQAAIDDGFAPAYAVVGEGSTGYSADGVTDVAVAHKGRRGSTLLASGTSAHASEVAAGENAVYRACDAVDVVRDLDFPAVEVLGHELRGSVAVTEIEGGEAWNVIPDRCEVTVDERTVPGERADLGRTESVAGVEWRVDQDLPPMACDDEAFAETVREAAAAAQEGDPELVTKPHATDAGWLADAGTTCVVCGAAEPGEAHTDDESVSVAVLERCYRIYRAAAERFDA